MNIKKIISDFSVWIFSGLTLFGFLLIYVGSGSRGRFTSGGETNIYFVIIGVILILPFIIYLIKTKIILKKESDQNVERINNLIRNGDVVIVNLDDLKIKANNYIQEVEVGSGYNSRNEYIDINHNLIFIDIPYKTDSIKYKLNINMDTTKLKMHFAIKEKTELYIDPENPNNNYLDLKFLDG